MPVEYRDYYKVLGVTRSATDREIKQAYRKLARQYHPDLNDGADAEDRFKEVTEAYEVLSDPDKRSRFDSLTSNYYRWQRSGSRSDFDWSSWSSSQQTTSRSRTTETDSGGVFSDFFRSVFGDSGRREPASPYGGKTPIHGQDEELEVTISLEESYSGTTRQVDRPQGKSFTARIPQGAKTGTKVRFAGQGGMGFAGGDSGSLYLVINVQDHDIFERRGDDLYMDVDVPLYAAVLGGDVRIPTLAGDVKLKIPNGTQSGKMIRLRDRGMPRLRDSREFGDLYARVLIQVPENLNEEEYELFERLADIRPNF